MLESGLILRGLAESGAGDPGFWIAPSYEPGEDESLLDWRKNPRSGLPVWLTIAAEKV
jgi:hypothetical protein